MTNSTSRLDKTSFPVKLSRVEVKLFAIIHSLLKASLFKAVMFFHSWTETNTTKSFRELSMPGETDNPKLIEANWSVWQQTTFF